MENKRHFFQETKPQSLIRPFLLHLLSGGNVLLLFYGEMFFFQQWAGAQLFPWWEQGRR